MEQFVDEVCRTNEWLKDNWKPMGLFELGNIPGHLISCSHFGPARWMQSETYTYYGQMKIGAPAEIPSFNSSYYSQKHLRRYFHKCLFHLFYLVGKGYLFFRRSGKVAEGWWNGQTDMVYGRYVSESIATSYIGHMVKEYFEGEAILQKFDASKTIYRGGMSQDKYDGYGSLYSQINGKATVGQFKDNKIKGRHLQVEEDGTVMFVKKMGSTTNLEQRKVATVVKDAEKLLKELKMPPK